MSIYETMNREQQKACFQTEGPVLILAGAGSGKTRVITHRIAYLIDECGVSPWNILAITFTNKAAGEMRERVDRILGGSAQGVWISTFHSMCVRILRRYIDLLGYEPAFVIYDTDDQKNLMKEACKNLRINTKELKEREILAAVSAAKNELLTPLLFRQENDGISFRRRQIGLAYEEYQRLLRKNNALDFDDLLMLTVQLFHARDEVLDMYRQRFRYIMVDEYQDTNSAQFELVRLLAGKYRNLCVVGDDDQSIYRFRGADIRNILDFEKVYPDAMVVRLEQNYRSTKNILDAANGVIRNNRSRKEKKLWTDRGRGGSVRVRSFASAMEEASFVAEDIRERMRQDSRLSWKDFAVLYRTNAQSRLLEERFVLGSIPYNIVGGVNFYSRREIKDVLSYLKTIDSGRDELSVRRIINVPRRGIGAATLTRAAEYAALEGRSLFDVMRQGDQIPGIRRAGLKLRDFADMILECREYAESHSLVELIRHVLDVTGYVEMLRASDEEDAEDREKNVDELISKLADYEQRMEEEDAPADLSGFLEDVALVAGIDSVEGEDDRVLLMTLHSAKGLEFPHVYITGMEENIFPSYQSLQDYSGEGLEEERRLAYVGITRAMDTLTLTSARTRLLRGELQYNAGSRFLTELPEDVLDDSAPGRTFAGFPGWSEKFDDFPDDDIPFGDPFEVSDDPFRLSGGRRIPKGGGRPGPVPAGTGRNAQTSSGSPNAGRPGSPNADWPGSPNAGRPGSPNAGRRPRAVYVKPHTADDKKPYIAKAISRSGSLSSLKKGMPPAVQPDYTAGDRVRHVKYGAGTVTSLEETPRDYKVTVQFDSCGQKIMYAGFAKLQKLE